VADQLKVDRSFTAVVNEPGGHAITGAVVALAHGLGMESVAEGIEDADQLASLASLGCDIAQGYLTGRPMPASEIFELLRRGAPHGGAVADEPAAPTRADRGS
jgi:EAL domain-containing protein (putative c-di-GMP-specific phosphodiesterase class I)